ncbi:MAG TPA: hypothetical protein VGZ47_06405 [Gemmataceae bacterium]|nr:hypothetical protein [Gemmataceae bacterium]
MMSFRGIACGAAVLVALAAGQAEAAWNNAFEVCCACRHRDSYYAAPVAAAAPNPCCNPCCSTSYVQRCYYQPVTTYKTECVPVTSYRTSYYWEPVCSYRTSCYVDPCTGCPVQVTQPVRTYRLKSQCNAVTSYVQRCVPVTSYRQVHYWEAVNSCGPSAAGGMAPGAVPGGMPGGVPGGMPGAVPGTVPGVGETGPPPNAYDGNRLPPMNVPANPPAGVDETPPMGSSSGYAPNRQYQGTPVPTIPAPKPALPAAPMRIEHVVSRVNPVGGATVTGQIVANNYVTPMRGTKLLFVSKQSGGPQQSAQADVAGRFSVALPKGAWNIYMSRPDGTLEYHSTIEVAGQGETRNVLVVSR